MRGIEKLKSGDFNDMSQTDRVGDEVTVTLSKRGEGKVYRFRVKDLYGEHEEVLSEEVMEV